MSAPSNRQKKRMLQEAALKQQAQILDVFNCVEQLHGLDHTGLRRSFQRSGQTWFVHVNRKGTSLRDEANILELIAALPRHLLACLLSGQPAADDADCWAPALTTVQLSHKNWHDYLDRGLQLLGNMCAAVDQTPACRNWLKQNSALRDQTVDLMSVLLLHIAGPGASESLAAAVDPHRAQETLDRASVAHSALNTLVLVFQPALLTDYERLDWHALCSSLLSHARADLLLDVMFDAVRTIFRMVDAAVRSSSAGVDIVKLSYHAGGYMDLLASFCAAPLFYYRLLQHDPACEAVIRLIATGVQLLDPPLAPPPWEFVPASSSYILSTAQTHNTAKAKGCVELLTARCIALMHTLAEYEEQAFLDQVWLQDSARALGQATARRILTQAGLVLRRPAVGEVAVGMVGEGQLGVNTLAMADVLADDSSTRKTAMDLLAGPMVDALTVTPAAFASRWCGGPEGASLHQRDEFDAGTWLAIWSLTPDSIKLAEVLKVLAHALRLVQLPPLISPSAAKARRQLEAQHIGCGALQRTVALIRMLGSLHYHGDDQSDLKGYFLQQFMGALQAKQNLRALETFMQKLHQVAKASGQLGPTVAATILSDEEIQLFSNLDRSVYGKLVGFRRLIRETSFSFAGTTLSYVSSHPVITSGAILVGLSFVLSPYILVAGASVVLIGGYKVLPSQFRYLIPSPVLEVDRQLTDVRQKIFRSGQELQREAPSVKADPDDIFGRLKNIVTAN
ncbi:hypothetical protein WJX84_011317 [Apatococcus fuscideae]|uniref:Nodulin homeobox N-terminal domain-containing protein n=1 Tax=Apatococcus fuscideae TaxID=2026836 RepID=A0AAW1SQ84_9CHLO